MTEVPPLFKIKFKQGDMKIRSPGYHLEIVECHMVLPDGHQGGEVVEFKSGFLHT